MRRIIVSVARHSTIKRGLLLFTCWVILGSDLHAAAPDKSGVKATSISLPKGAGSIEGLGESFEPQLNTGSSTYGISISIPQGRAGLQPKVHLSYNSNQGNSCVGLGWSLEFPSIKRQTDKGFPSYTSRDVFLFAGEELVPLSNPEGDWRCENESGFQRFRQITTGTNTTPNAWEMTERDGTKHFFGLHKDPFELTSVITHPDPPLGATTEFDRTYSWALDRTQDLQGNRIDYEYVSGEGILYPSRITYSHHGENYYEVRFLYEARPDVFDDYRPTFSSKIDRRLQRIEINAFYDSVSHPVRAYQFDYNYRDEDGVVEDSEVVDLGVSTLKRVTHLDRSGDPNNILPPLLLLYTTLDLRRAELHSVSPPGLDLIDSSGNTQIADVDGDGLPDIISTPNEIISQQLVCWNRGMSAPAGGKPELVFSNPVQMNPSALFRLGDTNSTLTDFDGDGIVDFVRLSAGDLTGQRLEVFKNQSVLHRVDVVPPGFSNYFRAYSEVPRDISYGGAAVRQMDVNFDKVSDFVSTTDDIGIFRSFLFYYREKFGSWVATEPIPFRPDMAGYSLNFQQASGEANPYVHLVDMNGDRLLDLVYIDATPSPVGTTLTVRYWPYCSLGQWGAMRVMSAVVGDDFRIGQIDVRDVLVEDLTGDGLADIAVLDSDGGSGSTLTLRVNVAGKSWSRPFVRSGLPRYLPRDGAQATAFRQADFNGNGSTDLLWRNRVVGDDSWKWLELMPAGKPNLLRRIDNGLGKVTEITYGSSTEDMVRAREAGYPWQTKTPFPVQVVRRLRTTCGLDLDGLEDGSRLDSRGEPYTTDQYVSEFEYRDAYYDPFEREFRGFAFAQRADFGDEWLLDTNLTSMVQISGLDASRTPTTQVSSPSTVTRYRYLTGAPDGVDNDDYPAGFQGSQRIDETTEHGGREEEVLKGRQIWEEKVDAMVLQDTVTDAGFDRGAYLAVTSDRADERSRMTPDAYVYDRIRQHWTVRRLYQPDEVRFVEHDTLQAPAAPSPLGRFENHFPKVRVLGGLGGSGRAVSFAFVDSVITEVIEANGQFSSQATETPFRHPVRKPVVTETRSDEDDYGNSILHEDLGVVSDPTTDDERVTKIEYALGGEALQRWILSEPARIQITDELGHFVSETNFFYDGQPFLGLPLGQLGSRALLHRTSAVVTGNNSLPALEDPSEANGDPRLTPGKSIDVSRNRYDDFGNALAHLDPLADPSSLAFGHAREIVYDDTFQMFPVREIIHVGKGKETLVMAATYDYGFGVLVQAVDFNGNSTRFNYDSFARLVAIVRPYDSDQFPTVSFEYQPADPTRYRVYSYDRFGKLSIKSSGLSTPSSRVISRQREAAGAVGTHVTVQYSDGLGRKLATVEEGEAPGTWIVSHAQSWGRKGAAAADWLPYDVVSGSSDVEPPHFGELWPTGRPPLRDLSGTNVVSTDHFHDSLGREIKTVNPPEVFQASDKPGRRTYSFTQLLPLEKRLFDENDSDRESPNFGTPMVQVSDGLGRLTEVREVVRLSDEGLPIAELVEWPTRYRYNLHDDLTHITDSQGNEKWFRYDGLGRKLFMNDPDRGIVIYTYDDASNLRETTDAKSQVIQYTYDGVNRLLTEDYLDNRGLTPDVRYHYDAPFPNVAVGDGTIATAGNTKGMLSWVEDLSGQEHTSYDLRGRVGWVIKRLADPVHGQLVSFRTGFAYDSLDRVKILTYPDSDQVGYLYNARNLLARITGGPEGTQPLGGSIIKSIAYRPSQQLAGIEYGNSVRTTYDYDPRLRLTNLRTLAPSSSPDSQLIHFAYEFDGVSNIKAIRDRRPSTTVAAGDKRRNTQLFQYDDLYRITRAQYSFAPPGVADANNGIISYRYDRIGNMVNQSSDIDHIHRGVSVTDLGAMNYGGTAGRNNRRGRTTPEPGPHALSSIANQKSKIGNRTFPYDANGNMALIDGLTNTWDFKDRLIRVEDDTMVARYTYDYTDRRVTKQVVWKPGSTNSPTGAANTWVLYPDKYFEVRESDAPVKYVWNGNTRVARVTGSLATRQRTQRLRVFPGMNLVSIAVTATNALSQLTDGASSASSLKAAYRWDSEAQTWFSVSASETLSARTVLWLDMTTNATLTVTGSYGNPERQALQPGGNFVGGWGLQPLNILEAFPKEAAVWSYEASERNWTKQLSGDLQITFDMPRVIAPGDALFSRSETAGVLKVPESVFQVRYYHEDHLGSSSVLTDGDGELISETANYGFGFSRSEYLPRRLREPYSFAQKENDVESGLSYFEARYSLSGTGRFCSLDPLADELEPLWMTFPQKLNLYSYCANAPTIYSDPSGCNLRLTSSLTQRVTSPAQLTPPANSISQNAPGFVMEHEGVRYRPYNDPLGFCTVGVGHLIEKRKCTTDERKTSYSQAQVSTLLSTDLGKAAQIINRTVKVTLNQNQFDALASFVFNIGEGNFKKSSVLKAVNAGRFDDVPDLMELWNKGTVKGKKVVLPGLKTRREAEGELFSTPVQQGPSPEGGDHQKEPEAAPSLRLTSAYQRNGENGGMDSAAFIRPS